MLQLPQSTVSRHLKTLSDTGWVSSRRDGTSRYYTLALDDRGPATRRLWSLLREQVGSTPGADQDAHRLRGVLAQRQTKSQEFFASVAGQWDRLRQDLFGPASYLHALPGLLDPTWTIGDLGCGTGQVAASLAPFVARVIAVDRSEDMLQAARHRLRDLANVDVRRGELEALPIQDGELDAATLLLVLHHLPDPGEALREAARVLKPGGRLLISRHAAARSRGLSAADGPRLARLQPRDARPPARRPPDSSRSASPRCRPTRTRKGPALFVAGATTSRGQLPVASSQ